MENLDWKAKIARARLVEQEILKWIHLKYDSQAHLPAKHTPEYDIISPVLGDIEVKEDRLAHNSNNYAFEFENFDGKPSGYVATTAKTFIIVDWSVVILIPTEALKDILRTSSTKRVIDMGWRVMDQKKCKGWLIPRGEVIHSPYAEVHERWFTVPDRG